MRYVKNDWPIARLAIPHGNGCACGLVGCLEPHLVLADVPSIHTQDEAAEAFSGGRWEIALTTRHVDVLELPARLGAPLHGQLKGACPTAIVPENRTWQFFVTQGSVPAELAENAGGRLISGPTGWVPAPGTKMDATGTIRWLIHPSLTKWEPYQRRDAIGMVFDTADWSAYDAPSSPSSAIVDGLLD
jgi:hypothetical protein